MAALLKNDDASRAVCLCVLFAINLLNYMDRMTVSGVLGISDPAKAGFLHSLSFTEGGMLQTVFVIAFMLLAPAFGYLGDRYDRRAIICAGILFWSGATLLCSFCHSYAQLLLCRALVGVGEASYATIAPTIIADLYPPASRTAALAFFYIGIPLGGALGYLGGVVGAAHGWQWAFRMTPPLGLVLAGAGWRLILNPERGAAEAHHEDLAPEPDFGQNVGLWALASDAAACFRVKSFTLSTIGFTAVTFTTGALGLWGPKFIVEATAGSAWHIETPEASYKLGVITAANGIVGTLAGAFLASLISRRFPGADPLVCAIGLFIAAPLTGACLFAFRSHPDRAWAMLTIAEFGLCLNWALTAAILLAVILPRRRSLAESLQILCSHVFGDALSPYVVGVVSDGLVRAGTPSSQALTYALTLCCAAALGGGLAFATCTFTYDADKDRMQWALTPFYEEQRRGSAVDDDDSFDDPDEVRAELEEERQRLLGAR